MIMAESTYASYCAQRGDRVRKLTSKLFEALIAPDDGVYLARTGSLLRHRTLRTRNNQAIFKTVLAACEDEPETSRFWTKRVLEDALKALIEEYKIRLPMLPGFSLEKWVGDQARLLKSLAQKAKRNSGRSSSSLPSGSSLSSMGSIADTGPTVPYEPTEDLGAWGRKLEQVFFPVIANHHLHKREFFINKYRPYWGVNFAFPSRS